MLFKKKNRNVKPELPKEYVWALEIDEVDHEFKCIVTEDEVITYEDGVEHKHLKVVDHTCEEGVLQIDCETKIFGELIPFQLERFIPYIKLDGRWIMSDTTKEDRLQQQIAIYKKQSKQEAIVGVAALLYILATKLITGTMGDLWILSVFGIFFISSAGLRMVRLKTELNAMKEAEEEAAAEKAALEAEKQRKTRATAKTTSNRSSSGSSRKKQSAIEKSINKTINKTANTIGRELGKQLVRGLLGTLKK